MKKISVQLKCLKMSSIILLMFASSVYSQNITNTLGTSGTFTIKDASNNYLTLSQSTGQLTILKSLRLSNTTLPGLGTIFKSFDRFIHDYNPPLTHGQNTFVGINSGNFTMNGTSFTDESSYNTGLGHSSLISLTTGKFNTGVGSQSLYWNTSGSRNTAIGSSSLYSNTEGFGNTAMGYQSLKENTVGLFNTAIGNFALYSNTDGFANTSLGSNTLSLNSWGELNTAVGYACMNSNTIGNHNTGTGAECLTLNTVGGQNTATGFRSMYNNTEGSYNTCFGMNSLLSNVTGSQNTSVGHHSLENNTGNYNTALGYNAGSTVTTGANLTLLGIDANPSSGTAIDQITLGNNFVTSLRCNVQTITSLSDARDKKNITDLSLGIDFLMKIKPRLFNWDKREWYDNNISDGSKMNEAPTAGFIAQELDEVQTTENAEWLNLVLKDNPEKLEATSGNLLPVMVKAIQELKIENDLLKQNNEKLSAEVEAFKSMNEKLISLEKKIEELNSTKQTTRNIRN